MDELKEELQDLKERLKKNEQRQVELQVENRTLRDQIEDINQKIAEVERSAKRAVEIATKADANIGKLASEVDIIHQLLKTVANNVEEIKEKNQQDMQTIVKLLQSIVDSKGERGGEQRGDRGGKQVAANKAAMNSLYSRMQKALAENIKTREFDKHFADLWTTIFEGWNERVNSDEDIGPDIEAVFVVLLKDIQNLAAVTSKSGGFFKSSPTAVSVFNQQINPAVYLPSGSIKSDGFTFVNGSQHATKMNYYYDIDETEVLGLATYVAQNFPEATKYYANSVRLPCIILTFIIVHDRMDMNRWITICDNRANKSEKHFVILVCNKLGDAIRSTTDKLACKALFKAEFNVEYDVSGMGGKPKQKYNKQSLDAVFAAIRQQLL